MMRYRIARALFEVGNAPFVLGFRLSCFSARLATRGEHPACPVHGRSSLGDFILAQEALSTKTDPRFAPDDRLSNLVKEGGRQEPYPKDPQLWP